MTITLHKLGDFYEAFDADAVLLAKEMKITLTTSRDGRKMAGVPYWALARYTDELEAKGYRVEVC